jgi:hypothetical protein
LAYKYNFFNPGISIATTWTTACSSAAGWKSHGRDGAKSLTACVISFRPITPCKPSHIAFRYEGDYIKVIGNSDLLLRADVRAPVNVTNFFGLGNERSWIKTYAAGRIITVPATI